MVVFWIVKKLTIRNAAGVKNFGYSITSNATWILQLSNSIFTFINSILTN